MLNWQPSPRSRAVVVHPMASVWKIRPHLAGLSRGSGLINPIPLTTAARNMKTRLKTPMTPTNPLTTLFQVLPCLSWPPAPPVTLPSHQSDGHVAFHSISSCLCTRADTSLSYIVDHFISLNAKTYYRSSDLTETPQSSSVSVLITLSHRKSKAPDYGSSDSMATYGYV